ncbi:MAG: enoyl-ACP reductase [Gammaproteobacteria bacterium]|jgi:enoyl-[acyl-carrier protein] reductase I
MDFLQNKLALITGMISNRSIAYSIAKAMHKEGAKLAFTYQNERVLNSTTKLAKEFDSDIVLPCDVTSDEQIANVFVELAKIWPGLDIIVHSIAYAPADQLEGDYLKAINRKGFETAHDISSYSFAALAKAGRSMMQGRNGALLTITYQGSERTVPNYNVMGPAKASLEANMRYIATSLGPEGIRANAISAGAIKTLASSGIKDFRKMLSYSEKFSALKRNVTAEDVGNTAAFLCSDLAAGITGEVIHVDAGFHCVGISELE